MDMDEEQKMDTDIDRKVAARVDAEAAAHPDPDDSEITSNFIRTCLYKNELGDGELFAALHSGRLVYNASAGEWYYFNGYHWTRDLLKSALAAVDAVAAAYLSESARISEQIRKIVAGSEEGNEEGLAKLRSALEKRVKKLRSTKGRTACLEFARTCDDPLAVTGDQFDSNPWLLACANGVIDLRTGMFEEEGRPEDYISLASPVEWKGIDAPAPLWEKTLLEIFHNNAELVSFIRRLFGYCLTGLQKDNVFGLLYGQGRNGKTLLVSILSYIMGPLARAIPAEMLLDQRGARNPAGPSPDIMMLKGLRLAFASESDEGRRFNSGRVKLFSGGDELTGRNPHDKFSTTFTPTHKLVLLTNDKPIAPAGDFAFWERLLLITFTISFVDREPQKPNERRADRDLLSHLKTEAPGILAFFVRGCLEWQAEGLNPPRSVTEATEQYRRDEDIIADFIDERLLVEPGALGNSSAIYAAFEDWYSTNMGKKVPSQHWFGKQLSKMFEKTKQSGRVYYKGITTE